MRKEKKKRKNLSDTLTHAYIRRIKKWMFCPACQNGKMTFNKSSSLWICEDCGYKLAEKEFKDEYVFWFCDECNTYLNSQEGFDRQARKHICQSCGYENDTTFENIKGICSDCGKTIPDPDSTLCADCRQERRKKAKDRLIKAGKAIGIVAATAGIVYIASQSDGGVQRNHTTLSLENDSDEDEPIFHDFICRRCGNTWTMAEDKDGLFNGYGLPPCPVCAESGCNPNDYADYICKYCGHQWRQYGNGGLVLGCIPRCPHCHC